MYYIGSLDDLFDFIIFTFTGSTGIMSLVGIAEIIGRDSVKHYLQYTAAETTRNPNYECTEKNISSMWLAFVSFIAIFSALAVISLEFIDRDKR